MIKAKMQTKLTFGLLSLFVVIICFGGLGIFYVNRLSSDAGMILKDNHISVEYCNHMLKALDEIPGNPGQVAVFEHNLRLEEQNITEPGEAEATSEVRALFETLKQDPAVFGQYKKMRKAILKIEDVNQMAIIHKNVIASGTAAQATLWLTIIVSILSLAALTFVINFPSIIARPVKALTEGIREIANKNYSKRIHLDQKDEFGTLAETFNVMAEKLDEYEHSNLAEIKFEKSRIEAIINKMNDGIFGLNDKMEILFFNAAAERIFGLKESEVTGRLAPDIAAGNDLLRTVLNSEPKTQLRIFADNKESFFTQESIVIQTENSVGGRVILLRNVTPFKELDVARTNFIATISHELKTPLFAIKMGTQLLEDKRVGDYNADQLDILSSIKANADRLLRITGELLNVSQVESGQIQLKKEWVKPGTIVLRALQAVQVHAGEHHIQLKEDIEKDLPYVSLDEEKTTWVLINFLTNAIKYSHENGTVVVQVSREEQDIHFRVTDQGRGIEPRYLDQVFDKYFKVPGGKQQAGTGLGLSISREFIEAQGGRIWARSEFGAGSVFGFSIVINTRV